MKAWAEAIERQMKRDSGMGDISRPKPKRRKKSDRTKAKEYADSWFSLFIRKRDGRCVTCKRKPPDVILECSHLYGKGSSSDLVRWDVRNAATQCKGCHFHHHTSTNKPLTDYIFGRLGQDEMDELWLRSKTVSKFSADTIKAFGDSFRARVKEMER